MVVPLQGILNTVDFWTDGKKEDYIGPRDVSSNSELTKY